VDGAALTLPPVALAGLETSMTGQGKSIAVIGVGIADTCARMFSQPLRALAAFFLSPDHRPVMVFFDGTRPQRLPGRVE